jgi:hypothetical protein
VAAVSSGARVATGWAIRTVTASAPWLYAGRMAGQVRDKTSASGIVLLTLAAGTG